MSGNALAFRLVKWWVRLGIRELNKLEPSDARWRLARTTKRNRPPMVIADDEGVSV